MSVILTIRGKISWYSSWKLKGERERDEATEQSSVFSEFSLAGSRSLLLLSFHSTFLVSASGSLGHTEIVHNFKRAKTGDQPLFLIFFSIQKLDFFLLKIRF